MDNEINKHLGFSSLQVCLCLCICEYFKCKGSNELLDVIYLSTNCSIVSLLSTPYIGPFFIHTINHDHVHFLYYKILLQNKNDQLYQRWMNPFSKGYKM